MKSEDKERLRRNSDCPLRGHHNSTLHSQHSTLLPRLAVGLGVPAAGLALCLTLLRGGHFLCLFHELTGLYCPGCGSGRAALAILHGRLGEAFGHNALLMLLAPFLAYVLVREYLRFVFPGLGLKPTRVPAWAGPAALVLILAFWLLRNLPAFSFLAP